MTTMVQHRMSAKIKGGVRSDSHNIKVKYNMCNAYKAIRISLYFTQRRIKSIPLH